MKTLSLIGLLLIVPCFNFSVLPQGKVKVLVVTGGHDFEHRPFYEVFNAVSNISYDTLEQPKANELIATPAVDRYDVLVFYDMFDKIKPSEQEAYVRLLKKGKAMIFLHHSLVSYQEWPEFKVMIGGQYHTRPTVVKGDTLKANYKHDVTMRVTEVDKAHPVTAGIDDFEITDERYGGCEILPGVKPLLDTATPGSMRPLAWINHYGNSEVIFIQLGHGPTAYANSNYRQLIRQAISWSAARHGRNR